MDAVDHMTEEELSALKEKIAQAEAVRKESDTDPASDERTSDES